MPPRVNDAFGVKPGGKLFLEPDDLGVRPVIGLSPEAQIPEEPSAVPLRRLRGTLVADVYYLRSCALKCRRRALRLQAYAQRCLVEEDRPPERWNNQKANAVKIPGMPCMPSEPVRPAPI